MVALLILALPILAAEPALSGRYTLAEDPDALARAHQQAVEDALAQLPWAARPFARSRLSSAVRSCGQLELTLTAQTFRTRCDAREPFSQDRAQPIGQHTAADGKTYEVRLQVDTDAVDLRFRGEQGGQATAYQPQSDGDLLVTKSIFSPHLPKPVAWTVRYRRAD